MRYNQSNSNQNIPEFKYLDLIKNKNLTIHKNGDFELSLSSPELNQEELEQQNNGYTEYDLFIYRDIKNKEYFSININSLRVLKEKDQSNKFNEITYWKHPVIHYFNRIRKNISSHFHFLELSEIRWIGGFDGEFTLSEENHKDFTILKMADFGECYSIDWTNHEDYCNSKFEYSLDENTLTLFQKYVFKDTSVPNYDETRSILTASIQAKFDDKLVRFFEKILTQASLEMLIDKKNHGYTSDKCNIDEAIKNLKCILIEFDEEKKIKKSKKSIETQPC
jgi:hypothetical protein